MRAFLTLVLCMLLTNAYAHDHNLATFTVYEVQGAWLLKVDFTTHALDHALLDKYPDCLASLSEKEYKEAAVNYFKENIHLKTNGETEVEFGPGGIKLGDHSSQLILSLTNFDPNWYTLYCRITCFKGNEKQSNLIRVKMGEDRMFKQFLRSGDDFQTTFEQARIVVRPSR